jgi:iron complex outermembrane receptor protein
MPSPGRRSDIDYRGPDVRQSLFFHASRMTLTALVATVPFAAPVHAQTAPAAELDEVTVTAERETATGPVKGYVARKTATATKTATPVAETPQSITVVGKEQIEAQGAETVAEALRYEAGVQSQTRPGNRYDSYMARGFGGFGGNANYISYWDGLRLPKGVNYAVPAVDPYLLERIEVLRGPSSAVYGQGFPGGLVNLVGKHPSLTTLNELLVRTGNDGLVEVGADLNGKLNDDGTLLYRFTGLGQRSDGEVDHTDSKRLLLAPSVTWRPDADTSVTAQMVYNRDPSSYYSYWLPALGSLQANAAGQIPRDFFMGDPSYDNFERTQISVGTQAEHRFDEVWTVRQNARYMHVDTDTRALSFGAYVAGSFCGVATSNVCMRRTPQRYVESLDHFAVDNMLQATVATGAVKHTVLGGLDVQYLKADADYGTGAVSYVNYLNPSYAGVVDPALTSRQEQERTQIGAYLQDQMEFGNWRALVGVRHDWTDATTRTGASGTSTSYDNTDGAFTWRAGLLYRFDNGVSPYVAYSTAFDPVMGTGFGGTPFEPTTSRQFEAGIKYEPPGVKGLVTLAFYDLTQQNVLTSDPDSSHTGSGTLCSSTTCQVQTGEVHARGLEATAKLEVLPQVNLLLAYAYTDAEVTKSNISGVQGRVPVGIAEHTASAWADYTFDWGRLEGLTVGAGVRYVGTSFGDTTNTAAMKVPAFALLDAALHYDFAKLDPSYKNWRASLTGSNLLDKTYVAACASATQCFYGGGRTVRASLAYRW